MEEGAPGGSPSVPEQAALVPIGKFEAYISLWERDSCDLSGASVALTSR